MGMESSDLLHNLQSLVLQACNSIRINDKQRHILRLPARRLS